MNTISKSKVKKNKKKKKHPILKGFLIFFGVIILLLGIFVFMLYNGVDMPVEDYKSGTMTLDDVQSTINDDFNVFLTDVSKESELSVGLTETETNQLLKSIFDERSNNPEYINNTNPEYFYKTDYFAVQGAYLKLDNKTVEMVAGAHAFLGPITFKTSVSLAFEVEESGSEMKLRLTNLSIGKIPLLWATGIADTIVKNTTGQSVDDLVNGVFSGMGGSFSLEKKELTIDLRQMVNSFLSSQPENSKLINSLLDFVYANQLFSIDLDAKNIGISLALGKMYDNSPIFTLNENQKITSNEEVEQMFKAKASALVLSILDSSSEGDAYLDLDELALNRLFNFYYSDISESDKLVSYGFENILIEADFPYVTITDKFNLNVPITITDILDASKKFQTIIMIQTTAGINEKNLEFTIESIKVGDLVVDKDLMENLLSLIGDIELIADGKIVIRDFDQKIEENGLSLEGIEISTGRLRIKTQIKSGGDLDTLRDSIGDVLDIMVDNPDYEGISDSMNGVINAIAGGEESVDEAIQNLINDVSELPDEEQIAFKDDLEQLLAGKGIDINDYLNKE